MYHSTIPEDVVIEKQLTEKDAIREALEAVQPEDSQASYDQESDTDIDEICVISNPRPLTPAVKQSRH